MADHEEEIEAALGLWPDSYRSLLKREGALIEAPDEAMLFGPGDPCGGFLTPLSGKVRVTQIAASGRSIVLYRVGPGDSCVLTTSCLLEDIPYDSYGYAEGSVKALSLPPDLFHGLLDDNPEFRKAVFAIYSRRILEMAGVIEDFLVHRADQKLITGLLKAAREDGAILITHFFEMIN